MTPEEKSEIVAAVLAELDKRRLTIEWCRPVVTAATYAELVAQLTSSLEEGNRRFDKPETD